MKFRLYREHGALNSRPIFDAFEQGLTKLGYHVDNSIESIPVIWSVVWQGRMKPNKVIFEAKISSQLPVIILEVGNLIRGKTWRVSVNNVNRFGYFGDGLIDLDRPKKLGIYLKQRIKNNGKILIAGQHQNSLQWMQNKSVSSWTQETVEEVRKFTDRPIVFRSHPRYPVNPPIKDLIIEKPVKIAASYDDFNIEYSYHAVINYNAGPSVQSAIFGTPIVCDHSSLAFPVSSFLPQIEQAKLPNRDDWLVDLCHKEWTADEISQGLPLKRILDYLKYFYP